MAMRGVVITRSSAHHVRQTGERHAGRRARAEELAPGHPVPGLLLQDGFDGSAGDRRLTGDAKGVNELLEQRGVCHGETPCERASLSISTARSATGPAPARGGPGGQTPARSGRLWSARYLVG